MSVLILLVLLLTESIGVTHWKLQDGVIKAVLGEPIITNNESDVPLNDNQVMIYDKELFILTKERVKTSVQSKVIVIPSNSENKVIHDTVIQNDKTMKVKIAQHKIDDLIKPPLPSVKYQSEPLTCGDPVDFTAYDFLEGVARRHELPAHAEPEVAMVFKKSTDDTTVDLIRVEQILRNSFIENPTSISVLNQIGNLWRVKGNTQHAIECFRSALSKDSTNPDVLLNLGRVLFNLNYIENTIFLTKLSLHYKQPRSATWLQHYTLGEAYKATRRFEEAAFYFRKAQELKPGQNAIDAQLREIESNFGVTNFYTILIILVLIKTVLVIMYYILCVAKNNT